MATSTVRTCDSHDTAHLCRPGHPAVIAWRRLQRFSARIDRLLDATLRDHGINRAQFDVLLTIGANEGLTQQQLAESIGLTRANVSQLLDRLQNAGLIERIPRGRAYALRLTNNGRELLEVTIPLLDQAIIEQFSALSDSDQTRLHTLLEQLDLCESNPE
jgi:DNA-binding MarR family transcriptional regulator